MTSVANIFANKINCDKLTNGLTSLFFFICAVLVCCPAFAQSDTSREKPADDTSLYKYDSATNRLIRTLQTRGAAEAKKSIRDYEEDRIATKQDELLQQIKTTTLDAKDLMKIGVDTIGLNEELKKIDRWYGIVSDGVFTNTGTAQTHRNLETSSKILRELLSKSKARKSELDSYYKDLIDFRNKIDSLNADSDLYKFSSDSAVLKTYIDKIRTVAIEILPVDSAFKKTLKNVTELQTRVNLVTGKLNSSLEQVKAFQEDLANRTLNREFSNLGDEVRYTRPFSEIINFSRIKGVLALGFYIQSNLGRVVLLIILTLFSSIFLINLKNNLRSLGRLSDNLQGQLVVRYPVLSAIVIVFNIFQFIFLDPPFIFNAIIWTFSAISLTIIFKNFITKHWMLAWLIMVLFFLFACADNLILQASRTERWIMLVLSVAGFISFSTIILSGRRKELKEKWIVYFIAFVAIIQIPAIIANIYGRYNLSKTLLSSGFFNVIIAILFLWTVRFINEGLSIATDAYRVPDKKLFYINFERIGRKAPPIFYVFLIIGWFVLFARNFYAYRLVADPINNFIFRKRIIGDFSFTIASVLGFFLILMLSAIISKTVSYFASDKHRESGTADNRIGVGSWLLLIRLSIMSLGLLLAFAATGIPMDRITIILSALSIGIGFGLQTLVNNLVSGLIISFEKPVNVGDIVEVGSNAGVVKSIGFRSSVISSGDGSEVVIPNGELLSQHLVNWTHNNDIRKVDITVGVAYGTDLENAKGILRDLLKNEERVLQVPVPLVLAKDFNNSSIDLRLLFWVRLKEWLLVKSDIISAIDIAFKENNIVIPFPQQDLHIRSVVMNQLEREDEDEEK